MKKKILSLILILTFVFSFQMVSYADEGYTYHRTNVAVGDYTLTQFYMNGDEAPLTAWSEFGKNAFPKTGELKRYSMKNTSKVSKVVFYYCVLQNYTSTKAKNLKIQNALAYIAGNTKGMTSGQISKAKSMVSEASSHAIPKYYHFVAYRYKLNKAYKGVTPSFITFKTNLTNLKVGVSWENAKCPAAVALLGGTSEILPEVSSLRQAKINLEDIDALIVPGGHSVNPSLYGDVLTYGSLGDMGRDKSELYYIEAAMGLDMPILAICRGHELLNVYDGGTLFQSTSGEWGSNIKHSGGVHHTIKVYDDTLLADILGAGSYKVWSSHYQCVGKIGKHIKVNARAKDGIVEASSIKDKTFVLTIQFHPEKEEILETPYAYKIFARFLTEAEKYQNTRKPFI
ncbi:MAG: gamma-glutamyl-gamma-aminobutyrate hydrolase family protein [Clostridia bacterium]|nr:gamma-glutamyl-gamma-aminobutyrate hydrolase family protein [Clostridia bacterium]